MVFCCTPEPKAVRSLCVTIHNDYSSAKTRANAQWGKNTPGQFQIFICVKQGQRKYGSLWSAFILRSNTGHMHSLSQASMIYIK